MRIPILILFSFLATAFSAVAAEKPNILFIMSDDHAIGTYGGRLATLKPTPVLDAPGAQKGETRPGWELYDLAKDPQEMKNVYANPAYKEVREQLKAELDALKVEVGDTDEKYPGLMKVREQYWEK